jgi:hypothetical protein
VRPSRRSETTESAAELLERSLARLRECERWRVEGSRSVEFGQPNGVTSLQQFHFTAAFERSSSRLRFEWGDSEESADSAGTLVRRGREVVLRDGDAVSSWPRGADQPWRCTSLAAALAEDAGGAAPLVGSLLLPSEFTGGAPRLGIATAAPPRREPAGGRDCWRIELVCRETAQVAWIATDTAALVRLEERSELGGVRITSTTEMDGSFEPRFGAMTFEISAPAGESIERGWMASAPEIAAGAFAVALLALCMALVSRRRRRS